MSLNQTGLLIIRAWVEHGSVHPLRARIRLTTDIGAGLTSEITLTNVSEVSSAVEAWLNDLVLNEGAASQ